MKDHNPSSSSSLFHGQGDHPDLRPLGGDILPIFLHKDEDMGDKEPQLLDANLMPMGSASGVSLHQLSGHSHHLGPGMFRLPWEDWLVWRSPSLQIQRHQQFSPGLGKFPPAHSFLVHPVLSFHASYGLFHFQALECFHHEAYSLFMRWLVWSGSSSSSLTSYSTSISGHQPCFRLP